MSEKEITLYLIFILIYKNEILSNIYRKFLNITYTYFF